MANGFESNTGWAGLGPVGGYMNKTANDFDPRNYGFNKLSELIAAIGLLKSTGGKRACT
jgi:hypothetical protein